MITIKNVVIVAIVAYSATLLGPKMLDMTNQAEAKTLAFNAEASIFDQTKNISRELVRAQESTRIALERKREREEKEKREAEQEAEEKRKAEEATKARVASYSPTNLPSAPSSGGDGWMNFRSTAYACSPGECSPSGITATGTRPIAWKTVAVDPSVIPLGSWIEIEGVGIFQATDTGGAIKGNKVDVFTGDRNQALQWGRRTIRVKRVSGPNG